MIIPMKKVSIRGPRVELKNTIDVLKSSSAFEMSNLRRTQAEVDTVDARKETLSDSLARTKTALDFIKTSLQEIASDSNDATVKKQARIRTAVLNTIHEVAYTELKSIVEAEARAIEIINTIEATSAKHFEIGNTLKRNKAAIKELAQYHALDTPFNALVDTEHTFVLAGVITSENFEQFKSDYDLSHIKYMEYPSTGKKITAILIGHKEDLVVAREIFSYGFERCKLNYNSTAKQKTKEYEELNKDLVIQKITNLSKCFVSTEDLKLLKTYYDYLGNELDTEEISSHTLQSEKFFVINGWIVGHEEDRIITLLKKVSAKIKVKIGSATEQDIPPTLVINNPVIAPYGSITKLYSQPGPKDIDPNVFVAIFYFLFFGIMVGDIGYGILMSVVAFAVIFFLKPKKRGIRDLILLIGMGGISTVLWGLFFGSFFGFSTSSGFLGKIFPSGVLDPVDNAIVFLGLSMGLGVAHIVFGLWLKFYNLLRQRKVMDAIFTAFSRIMFFIGAGMVVCGMFLDDHAWVSEVGIWVVVAAIILIVIGGMRKKKGIMGKLSGGFAALYSLVNYFSDILSYARLFGLGLVGAVIATVANSMGAMLLPMPILGIPLAILVAVMFHAFNLAIGLLSAYVHNARLQFIEFFSKFYQGGGKQFVPMGSELRYTKIRGVK